ncbi:hypothetical protein BG004_001148 [Podila humilis]|nr:hypothetical protein BG004_001148 [Podila humilis]
MQWMLCDVIDSKKQQPPFDFLENVEVPEQELVSVNTHHGDSAETLVVEQFCLTNTRHCHSTHDDSDGTQPSQSNYVSDRSTSTTENSTYPEEADDSLLGLGRHLGSMFVLESVRGPQNAPDPFFMSKSVLQDPHLLGPFQEIEEDCYGPQYLMSSQGSIDSDFDEPYEIAGSRAPPNQVVELQEEVNPDLGDAAARADSGVSAISDKDSCVKKFTGSFVRQSQVQKDTVKGMTSKNQYPKVRIMFSNLFSWSKLKVGYCVEIHEPCRRIAGPQNLSGIADRVLVAERYRSPRRPHQTLPDIPPSSAHHSALKSLASAEGATPPCLILLRVPTRFQAVTQPVLFTTAVSFGAFALGAYFWEKRQVSLLKRIQAWRAKPKYDRPSISEFLQEQGELVQEQFSELRERFRWIQQLGIPVEVQKMLFMARQRWKELSPGERTVWSIIGLNTIVFGAWQVPRWAPFMQKWFMHHPARGKSITLLTSMFSHQHFWHFGLNMFALHSFAVPLHDHMGMEQFLAFYITTGVTASLVSHLFTVSRLAWAQMIPSLGASGALFGCVSSTAYMYPDASVYIIFLPFLPIKIPVALGAMMGLDLVGIIKNWKMFDHYAHLAGSTFGLAYMYGGKSLIWQPMQEKAIECSKDSNLFARFPSFSPASSNDTSKKPTAPPSSPILKDMKEYNSHDSHSAREYVHATSEKIKSWWSGRKGGDH